MTHRPQTAPPPPSTGGHPTAQILAELLAGELPAEVVREEVLPHLLQHCPQCQAETERIHALRERLDHWSEAVAVREAPEAPALLIRLLAVPPAERFRALTGDDGFHTWGLAQELLGASRAALITAPERALELASLAAELPRHLPPSAYHPDWIEDLEIRALTRQGHAQRALGDSAGAAVTLARLRALLSRGGTGRPSIAARVAELAADLAADRGQHEEALVELERARALFTTEGDGARAYRCRLARARVLCRADRAEQALEALADDPPAGSEPDLGRAWLLERARALLATGRPGDARAELAAAGSLLGSAAPALHRAHRTWLDGAIAAALDEPGAVALLLEARSLLLELGCTTEAATVTLELARRLMAEGRAGELAAALGDAPAGTGASPLVLRVVARAARAGALSAELLGWLEEEIRRP